MNPIETIIALFSGERISYTDTLILATVVLVLWVSIKILWKKMNKKDR